jgi:hypothetical protein
MGLSSRRKFYASENILRGRTGSIYIQNRAKDVV